MSEITKYVLVKDSGNWYQMAGSILEIALLLKRRADVHIEKWIYLRGDEGDTLFRKIKVSCPHLFQGGDCVFCGSPIEFVKSGYFWKGGYVETTN